MKIGFTELAVVFLVALFVIGPDKLPVYAKKLGEALAQFRKASDEATKEIRESIVEPLGEAQKPFREAIEPLEDLDRTIRGNVKDVKKSLSDIGKPEKKPQEPQIQEIDLPSADQQENRQISDSAEVFEREEASGSVTSNTQEREIGNCEAVQQSPEISQRKEEEV